MNGNNQTQGIQNNQSISVNPNYISAQINFLFRARMLWRDLATWLSNYMVSLYSGVGNTDEISKRLYNIPAEYGNILRSYFGDQTTEQYMNLLVQYIALLQSLFTAQINNDVDSINNLIRRIYENVNTRADFLASINPYWGKSEWISLESAFTRMVIEQFTTILTKDYEKTVDVFDRILALTNIMGDYFSEGLNYYFFLTQPQQPSSP